VPVEFVSVPVDAKVVVLRDARLLFLDHPALEFHDLPALGADEVIVMLLLDLMLGLRKVVI